MRMQINERSLEKETLGDDDSFTYVLQSCDLLYWAIVETKTTLYIDIHLEKAKRVFLREMMRWDYVEKVHSSS